jgi:hypothetical protein
MVIIHRDGNAPSDWQYTVAADQNRIDGIGPS